MVASFGQFRTRRRSAIVDNGPAPAGWMRDQRDRLYELRPREPRRRNLLHVVQRIPRVEWRPDGRPGQGAGRETFAGPGPPAAGPQPEGRRRTVRRPTPRHGPGRRRRRGAGARIRAATAGGRCPAGGRCRVGRCRVVAAASTERLIEPPARAPAAPRKGDAGRAASPPEVAPGPAKPGSQAPALERRGGRRGNPRRNHLHQVRHAQRARSGLLRLLRRGAPRRGRRRSPAAAGGRPPDPDRGPDRRRGRADRGRRRHSSPSRAVRRLHRPRPRRRRPPASRSSRRRPAPARRRLVRLRPSPAASPSVVPIPNRSIAFAGTSAHEHLADPAVGRHADPADHGRHRTAAPPGRGTPRRSPGCAGWHRRRPRRCG